MGELVLDMAAEIVGARFLLLHDVIILDSIESGLYINPSFSSMLPTTIKWTRSIKFF